MSGLYSHLHEELGLRLEEAEQVAPNAARKSVGKSEHELQRKLRKGKGQSSGGRDRERTGAPLLAKQMGENTKSFVWWRLHGKPTKFSLSNCCEVVPNFC